MLITRDVSKRNIGVTFNNPDEAEIRVWSPLSKDVYINIGQHHRIRMNEDSNGYWLLVTDKIKPGDRYSFSINGENSHPDPASLSQPDGVHETSATVDLNAYHWTDSGWKNPPIEKYILYELHTGTFSPGHNFEGIEKKLDYLADLGITAIEIMPVGQFPGSRNWGYDGVYPFAVQHSYGGAAAFQRLVDACHKKGIAVILDVIYNHIGPEGNYFPAFGPYFTDKYRTPWGKALNYDDDWCNGVRDYFIENALMWFRDFHIDALRLDAVHAIKDNSQQHFISELKQHTNKLMEITGRTHYLIAEMDLNDPVFINPVEKNGYGVDAQWIDEFHHALRVSAGQKKEGYYTDFNGIEHLAKSYNDAYVYDGQFSEHRKKIFGLPTSNPGNQFFVFSQNHDQTGNRMLGERTSQLVSFEMCKLLAGAVFTSPFLPMLFMGEEWAEKNPFLFFISHTDKELAAIVNNGRKEEFSSFNWLGEPPDPRLKETFTQSLLQWELLKKQPHHTMYQYYKMMIALRKNHPVLKHPDRNGTEASADTTTNTLLLKRWNAQSQLICAMNFSGSRQQLNIDKGYSWRKIVDSASPEWGGSIASPDTISEQLIIQPESILIYERIL